MLADTFGETFTKPFTEGPATEDFEPTLRLLVGERAPLWASVIRHLTQKFRKAHEEFDRRQPEEHKFASVWATGSTSKPAWARRKPVCWCSAGRALRGRDN